MYLGILLGSCSAKQVELNVIKLNAEMEHSVRQSVLAPVEIGDNYIVEGLGGGAVNVFAVKTFEN